jgi:predicted transcriptional regulator
MSFEESIKEWVTIDNKIKQLNEQCKTLRNTKNELTNKINNYVDENELKHATVQISDGKLKFQTVKVTQPLTLKFIKECLDNCIQNESTVERIINYIKENRKFEFVDDIKRYNK